MIDRVEQAKGLLIQQYKDSPSIVGMIEAFATALQGVEDANNQLLLQRTISTAAGVNLDIIGKIVVLPRPFRDPDPELVFTFDNLSGIGSGFSGIGRSDVGGFFIGLDPFENALANDEEYRLALRAKIIRNTTTSTIEALQNYISFVFETQVVITSGIGYVDVTVGRPLSVREKLLLEETIPVAAGIRLGTVAFSLVGDAFGFAGNENSTGFGGVGVPQEGGGFTGLI